MSDAHSDAAAAVAHLVSALISESGSDPAGWDQVRVQQLLRAVEVYRAEVRALLDQPAS